MNDKPRPVDDAIGAEILAGRYVQADETLGWTRFSDQQKHTIGYGMRVRFDFYLLIWNASTSVCKGIPIFFALERKARLASERSGEACAGLWRKSKKNRTPEGGEVSFGDFHAAIFIAVISVHGRRSVS